MDRLASFFYETGGLAIRNLQPIKDHVLLITTVQGENYVLKRYKFKSSMIQQWKFFKKTTSKQIIMFTHFPNGKEFLRDKECFWTMTPYAEGKVLKFSLSRDRKDAIKTLETVLHDIIGTRIAYPKIKANLYVNWRSRLRKWEQVRWLFFETGHITLFNEISDVLQQQLTLFSHLNWSRYEQVARDNWIWVHGDVAAHNFLRQSNSNRVYLIDFDLLSLSPHLHDWIQLGQRFLPDLKWSLSRLLTYPFLDKTNDPKAWLVGVSIPADLVRECWFFSLKEPETEQIQSFVEKLQFDWNKRKQFVEEVNSMLR